MPKIKHIAVTTTDPADSVEFYKGALGLDEILRDDEKVIRTDGYIVFALLVFEADKFGGGRPRLHHFGFEIDDMDVIEEKMCELGGRETTENWVGEKKGMDPQGVAFDINPTGWGH